MGRRRRNRSTGSGDGWFQFAANGSAAGIIRLLSSKLTTKEKQQLLLSEDAAGDAAVHHAARNIQDDVFGILIDAARDANCLSEVVNHVNPVTFHRPIHDLCLYNLTSSDGRPDGEGDGCSSIVQRAHAIVERMHGAGCNFNSLKRGGWSPLCSLLGRDRRQDGDSIAIELELVTALTACRADWTIRTSNGWLPIHFCARHGRIQVFEWLVTALPDSEVASLLQSRTDRQALPLHLAVVYGHRELVVAIWNAMNHLGIVGEDTMRAGTTGNVLQLAAASGVHDMVDTVVQLLYGGCNRRAGELLSPLLEQMPDDALRDVHSRLNLPDSISLADYAQLQSHITVGNLQQWMARPHQYVFATAHPDDECMFFTPTLLELRRRHPSSAIGLVVFSRGNIPIRAKEMAESWALLGYEEVDLLVLDDPELRDGMDEHWSPAAIHRILGVLLHCRRSSAVVHTFDSYGISGHINHRCLGDALVAFVRRREPTTHCIHQLLRLRSLGMLEKYGFVRHRGAEPSDSVSFSHSDAPRVALACMQNANRSQFVWYRRLWLWFSVYMRTNVFDVAWSRSV